MTMYKKLSVFLFAILMLTSCGIDGNRFRLEGRILNINQGEFYVYDEEGLINGVDTIKVEGGRFAYEMVCERPTTIMLVFPNFSEQPIFAEPGKSVDIQGDASRLKEMTVKGSKQNELMNVFREQIISASPPETKKYAGRFIEDHPESPVSAYLVKRYFLGAVGADYKEAGRLIGLMLAKQPANTRLARTAQVVKALSATSTGSVLPTFTAYDMKGRMVASSDLSGGLAVICTWASWSYDSMAQLRRLKSSQKKSAGRLKLVSVSLDADRHEAQNNLDRDSIQWPNICDGMLFEGRVVKTLGLMSVPDNILVKNGRIIARSLPIQELEEQIEKNL